MYWNLIVMQEQNMGPEIQVFSIAQVCHVTKVCLYYNEAFLTCWWESVAINTQCNQTIKPTPLFSLGLFFSLPGTLVNVKKNTLTLSIICINNLSTYLCNKVYLKDTHFIWNYIPINRLYMINWPLNSSVNHKQYYRRIQFHWKLRKSLLFSKQVLKS